MSLNNACYVSYLSAFFFIFQLNGNDFKVFNTLKILYKLPYKLQTISAGGCKVTKSELFCR